MTQQKPDRLQRWVVPILVPIIIAVIGALGTVGGSYVGRTTGVSEGKEQARATATVQQATIVAVAAAQPTQTPVEITRIVEATRIIEATRLIEITSTPGPTQTPIEVTRIVEVTATPTSIAPEGVDTLANTVLGVGQTWYQQGLSMTVDGVVFEDTVCGGISVPRSDWGTWNVDLVNNTNQDLVVNIDQTDFFLRDNRNQDAVYNILYSNEPCGYIGIDPPGRINTKTIKAGSTVTMKVYGVGQVGDTQFFTFGIRDGGRIKNATWRIDVPR